MDPMIKYRGGKSREIQYFSDYIPDHFDTYYEPFLGGGAVYFYLEHPKSVINDVNGKLMSFYSGVRDNYEQITSELLRIQEIYEQNQEEYSILKRANPEERVANKNEDLYYQLRDMYNHKIPSIYSDGALYFFINKTAYSGMIRYNSKGEYNVPFGRYPHFNTRVITRQHQVLLSTTRLFCTDYSDIFKMAGPEDFMFLDPPYDCIFNDYGNIDMMNGFDEAQHRRLAADFKQLRCKALMVIGKTELTEELYGPYIKDEYNKNYAVNIKNRFKRDAKHIIVTNYRS